MSPFNNPVLWGNATTVLVAVLSLFVSGGVLHLSPDQTLEATGIITATVHLASTFFVAQNTTPNKDVDKIVAQSVSRVERFGKN